MNRPNFSTCPKRGVVYDAIVEHINSRHLYPTPDDLAALTGFTRVSVFGHCENLARQNLILFTIEETGPRTLSKDEPLKVRVHHKRELQDKDPQRIKDKIQMRDDFTRRKANMRRRSKDGSPHTDDLINLRAQQNNKCWWCGCDLDQSAHIDHRIPLSRGGTNDIGNLCLTCPECNLAKSDKMPWEFNGRLL